MHMILNTLIHAQDDWDIPNWKIEKKKAAYQNMLNCKNIDDIFQSQLLDYLRISYVAQWTAVLYRNNKVSGYKGRHPALLNKFYSLHITCLHVKYMKYNKTKCYDHNFVFMHKNYMLKRCVILIHRSMQFL